MNALTGVDHLPCASGSQLFIGKNHTFVPNQININTKANFSRFLFIVASCAKTVKSRL